jgi:hypothetical protein
MKSLTVYMIFLVLFYGCSKPQNGTLIYVEPEEGKAFHFPYFLFIPDEVAQGETIPLIIESNNSGFADDDLQPHIEKAKRIATKDFYAGNYAARNLNLPLVVPVFPRPKTEWKIYTHALDRDVMAQTSGPLKRPDEQLMAMFDDARIRLREKNIKTGDKFLMTGFSASGTFANRFTVIHPDKVLAVAAGGLNGLLMLPLDSLQGEALKYPVGTSDMNELLNREFQKEPFLNTPQFYFMGALDDNDAVPYDDAFDQDERNQIYRLLGKEMQPERWHNCRKIYTNSNAKATIITFENAGHEQPESVKKEIVEFFRTIVRGKVNR